MKGKIVDGEARDRLIIWIRRRMADFGITPEALAASIQHDLDHRPLYRDARGNEWNGLGDMPDWLHAAKHAGVSPDFFRIERESPPAAVEKLEATNPKADSHQLDLFA
jgi:DNA-binding protein H-NS